MITWSDDLSEDEAKRLVLQAFSNAGYSSCTLRNSPDICDLCRPRFYAQTDHGDYYVGLREGTIYVEWADMRNVPDFRWIFEHEDTRKGSAYIFASSWYKLEEYLQELRRPRRRILTDSPKIFIE